MNRFRKILQFVTNPHLLICMLIAWMITNGWAYIMLLLGKCLGIEWMMAVSSAYIAFVWLPFSSEKAVTFAIAIALLRLLFPNDQKTLAVLKELFQKAKEKNPAQKKNHRLRTKTILIQWSENMNILVTLDRNYLKPLRIMLGSMFLNNPGENFNIYIAADGIEPHDLHGLEKFRSGGNVHWHFVDVDESLFANAPTLRYYSRAMYYRLLAAQMLPDDLDKILYLDPDILVIGKLRPLYETKLDNHLYAAAMHKGLLSVSAPISKLRIPEHEADSYFNSGVLLMNLKRIREEVDPQDIFEYVRKYHQALVLPDQDVINGLYGIRILPLDESVWNYDARKFETYLLTSQGKADMDWTMHNTAILHFCGKKKPWNPSYRGRFSSLYKHYQALVDRCCE